MRWFGVLRGSSVLNGLGMLLPGSVLFLGLLTSLFPTGGIQAQESTELRGRAPVLTVGSAFGDPDHLLHGVVDAVFVGEDRFLSACAGTGDLRLFDMDGSLVRSFGRPGEGPGEHRGLARIFVRGDTVWSYDEELVRLNRWLITGEFLGTTSIAQLFVGHLMVADMFSDGSFLGYSVDPVPNWEPGLHQNKARVFRIFPKESHAEPLGELSWRTTYIRVEARGRQSGSTGYAPPLTAEAALASTDVGFWFTDSRRAEIVLNDAKGGIQERFAVPVDPIPVSESDRDSFAEKWLEPLSEQARPRGRAILGEMPFPSHLPVVTDLVVSKGGVVWAGIYPRAGEPERTWFLFSEESGLVGRAILPAKLRLEDVDDGWALGVEEDEFGVEYLVIIPLAQTG
jgi:hypothetical protein